MTDKLTLSPEHAAMIAEAHDIRDIEKDQEERELLEQHNPSLLEAYEALLFIADHR